MKTHNQRREWMEDHGWYQIEMPSPHDVRGIGKSVRFEEQAGHLRGLWMAISTGVSLLDGPRDEAMTFQELQKWIEGREEQKKPLANQKTLFE
jgi:hypothetical protein